MEQKKQQKQPIKIKASGDTLTVLLSEEVPNNVYNNRHWLSGYPEDFYKDIKRITSRFKNENRKYLIFNFKNKRGKKVDVPVTIEELNNPKNYFRSYQDKEMLFFSTPKIKSAYWCWGKKK